MPPPLGPQRLGPPADECAHGHTFAHAYRPEPRQTRRMVTRMGLFSRILKPFSAGCEIAILPQVPQETQSTPRSSKFYQNFFFFKEQNPGPFGAAGLMEGSLS